MMRRPSRWLLGLLLVVTLLLVIPVVLLLVLVDPVSRGLPVGVVRQVSAPSDRIFKEITVQPFASFQHNETVYVVGSGRVNVAGMTEKNMDRLSDAVMAVL